MRSTVTRLQPELSRLSASYLRGEIGWLDYRAERAIVIDRIVIGEVDFALRVEESDDDTAALVERSGHREHSGARSVPASAESMGEVDATAVERIGKPRGSRTLAIAGGSVALIVAVAVPFYFFDGRLSSFFVDGAADSRGANQLHPSADDVAGATSTEMALKTLAFGATLQREDMDRLVREWEQLDEEDRLRLRTTEAFVGLQAKVNGALLSAPSDGKARLLSFANVIGASVDLPAVDSAVGVAAVTAEPRVEIDAATAPSSPAVAAATASPGMPAPAATARSATAPRELGVLSGDSRTGDNVRSGAQSARPAAPAVPAETKLSPAGREIAQVPIDTTAGPTLQPAQRAGVPMDGARRCVARGKGRAISRNVCWDLVSGQRGPELIAIPAGSFVMGDAADRDSAPVRQVVIANGIAVSVNETSVKEYRQFCTATAGRAVSCASLLGPEHDSMPVTRVSWDDAVAYTEWLSTQTGARYRLPTESEWEYAARAGTKGRFPFVPALQTLTASHARFAASSPVALTAPIPQNEFGLRHVIGNVAEWVADDWTKGFAGAPTDGSARLTGGREKVVRGGAYNDLARKVTAYARRGVASTARDASLGFRVLREM